MRKIIVSEFLTLDGVMEAPQNWRFPYASDDLNALTIGQIMSFDAFLLGRATYDEFAPVWSAPGNSDNPIGAKLTNAPKYVVSSTLQTADWNNSVIIRENIIAEITRLKQQSGGDIGVTGSGMLVQALLEAHLIDELHLLFHPLILGTGKRLFAEGIDTKTLQLVETKAFTSGVVAMIYQPATKS
ncbi:MAG: dihydrofolate reductase [Anaerolineae bacterium]|nr:dihydrofolate reductase [Anaerolineae bacterium]